jgi:hypothetical protein
MDLFSFLSFHFMCVTVTVVTGHSMALNRRSHLFSTMSSLHDVLVHDKLSNSNSKVISPMTTTIRIPFYSKCGTILQTFFIDRT